MKVALAAIADFASGGERGKLNVMGIFDTIWAKKFPSVHASLTFVVRVLAEYADSETTQHMKVRLMRPDGGELLKLEGDVAIPTIEPGSIRHVNAVFQLNGVKFPASGVYTFVVSIGDAIAAEAPLRVAVGGG